MNWKYNKFDAAIGAFWAASLFAGALVAVIIGFGGDNSPGWKFAVIVGGLVFLLCGLTVQGIITLMKKGD